MFIDEKKFWLKTIKGSKKDCWPWLGTKNKRGYGKLSIGNKPCYAHRIAWELHYNKEIEKGQIVSHTCKNNSCVNPDHLFLGAPRLNYIDSKNKNKIIANGGRPADKLLIVVLYLNQEYTSLVLHPNKMFPVISKWYSGPMLSLGVLKDRGFEFSNINSVIPKWVIRLVPSQYIITGVCKLIAFPTPE